MIIVENCYISDDICEVCFVCDVKKCRGACCVEGDAGAPLEMEEIGLMEDYLEEVKPYMTEEGIAVVESMGVFDYDVEGCFVTPLVKDRECAFVYFEEGVTRCAIEKAWEEKKQPFQKPISCSLYPIRITSHESFDALNYHKWPICKEALRKGRKQGVPLYKFLKEPLVRKYGKAWYDKLVKAVGELP
ncbi:MAG: hypothetical protein CSA95_07280 [Bacteroidetes bacterium]|nr:MAG: hypothetical protein CSA95_07280 [Bacteroidota bacterium]